MSLQVLDILPGTAVDGPGLRTSIYFAGCAHRCPECHNPQSWDFSAGRSMTVDEILAVVEDNGFNVTLSGGDPMYQAEALLPLVEALTSRGYRIWCYTGFTLEQLLQMPHCTALLPHIEVLVDGPFIASLRNTSLRFCGSSNQRLLHLPSTLSSGTPVLWTD